MVSVSLSSSAAERVAVNLYVEALTDPDVRVTTSGNTLVHTRAWRTCESVWGGCQVRPTLYYEYSIVHCTRMTVARRAGWTDAIHISRYPGSFN